MKYLENIGIKAKKAFENLKRIEHRRIQKALRDYSHLLQSNESKIIKENLKDVKKAKRGNLIDRLLYGKVIDFLDIMIGNFHWYIFNIADSAVCSITPLSAKSDNFGLGSNLLSISLFN